MPLFFPLWLNMLDGWQTLIKGHKCATCKTTMISLIAGTFWPACSKDLCLEENLWAHLYLPPLKGMAAPGQLAFILTPRDFKGGKRLRNAPQTKYLSVLHPSVVIFFTTALPSFMAPSWQFFKSSMGPHQLVAAPLRFPKLSITVDFLKNVPPVEAKKTRYTSGVSQTYAPIIPLVFCFHILDEVQFKLEFFSIHDPWRKLEEEQKETKTKHCLLHTVLNLFLK